MEKSNKGPYKLPPDDSPLRKLLDAAIEQDQGKIGDALKEVEAEQKAAEDDSSLVDTGPEA